MLSDRIRPNSEAAPWVLEEIKKLEQENKLLRNQREETLQRAVKLIKRIYRDNHKLRKEKIMMKEALEFYGIVKEQKNYKEAFTMAKVINEDLSDYIHNGVKFKVSGKKAREVLDKLKERTK